MLLIPFKIWYICTYSTQIHDDFFSVLYMKMFSPTFHGRDSVHVVADEFSLASFSELETLNPISEPLSRTGPQKPTTAGLKI